MRSIIWELLRRYPAISVGDPRHLARPYIFMLTVFQIIHAYVFIFSLSIHELYWAAIANLGDEGNNTSKRADSADAILDYLEVR